MADQKKRAKERRAPRSFPFGKRNYQLFGIGVLVLVVGFFLLSIGPADSFWSLTLAPVVLVFGYLVVIPASILYRDKGNS